MPAGAGAVRARLDEIRADLPPDTRLELVTARPSRRGSISGDVADAMLRALAERAGVMVVAGDDATLERLPGELDVYGDGRLDDVPGIAVRPEATTRLAIRGDDRERLAAIAEELRALAIELDGVEAAIVVGVARAPTRSITLERDRLAALGIERGAVVDALRMAAGGLEVATMHDGGRTFPVRLRWAELDANGLPRVVLRARDGSLVPFDGLVSIEAEAAPLVLLRTAGSPSVRLELGISPAAADRVERALRDACAGHSGGTETCGLHRPPRTL
jgi:multidrug efflux pump subunit AcrB